MLVKSLNFRPRRRFRLRKFKSPELPDDSGAPRDDDNGALEVEGAEFDARLNNLGRTLAVLDISAFYSKFYT